MFHLLQIFILCLFTIVFSAFPGYAQTEDTLKVQLKNSKNGKIKVFIDCQGCDIRYIRQEITFVNYVRDQQLAQVHVFITDQGTASGGRTYTLSFIGQKEFSRFVNTLTYTSLQSNTNDEERAGLSRMLRFGLVSYVAHTPFAEKLSISFDEDIELKPLMIDDPWNNWVFEIYGGGNFNKEASRSSVNIRYGFSADHITEKWRIRARPYFNYNEQNFEQNGDKITSKLHRNGFEGSAVRSLGNHWSAGISTDLISTTYDNIDFGMRIAPAIEYSIFPYEDVTRKEITFAYRAGYDYRNYMEETIFNKMEETLFFQSLNANVRIRQPWGAIFAGMEGSHFLHDFSKNRVEFDGSVSLRIMKGFSLTVSGNLEIINDQLSLQKGDASLEEILLSQRQLATTYEIYGSIGLSYTFGSIYNNVVNTRL